MIRLFTEDVFDASYRDHNADAMIDMTVKYVDKRLDEYLNVLGEN